MSHKNLSPRQKMISMMYLVLTAMLAMNVSKEVLNAFVVVNEGIENTNRLVNDNNSELYAKFIDIVKEDKSEKTNDIYKLVLETQKLTKASIDYISVLRNEILTASGKNEDEKSRILFAKLDDLETATRILTVPLKGSKPKGELLREELFEIKESYLDIIEKGNPTELNTIAYTNYRDLYERKLALQAPEKNEISLEGKQISWIHKNFYNVPVVATDVILTKLQNDIYSSEADVLEFLYNQIGASDISFDQLSAAVISPKSYLPAGKTFEADIFIAASSSQQVSEVFVGELDKSKFELDEKGKITMTHVLNDELFFKGNFKPVEIQNGKAKFETITSGVGVKKHEGIIRVKQPTGGYDLYPFNFDYEVAPKSGFSVSPTAMNVLYIGIDNPISITVSGSKDSDVSAVMSSNGSVKRKANSWIATVTKQGKTTIDVYGVIDNEKKLIGKQEFRAKRIPDPIPTLDGVEYGNSIKKARLVKHNAVLAKLKNFEFEVGFKIVSFDFLLKSGNDIKSVNGVKSTLFSKRVKDLLKSTKKKDVIFFQNIYAVGPDNKKRKINPIILTIK